MAEGRMLKKKISLDGRWADLASDTHRLLFTIGIAHLDIEGRISGDPREFKAAVAPMLDHITKDIVLAFFDDAGKLGLIQRYYVNGQWVVHFPGFKKNQNLRAYKEAPSRYPSFPSDSPSPECNSGTTPGIVQKDSRTTPAKEKEKKVNINEDNKKANAFIIGEADDLPASSQLKPSDLVKLWNDLGCKPRVSKLTDERQKKASVRLRERSDCDWWRSLFEKVRKLNKPWLTFDFLMKNDTNCLKVLEGNYDLNFKSRDDCQGQRSAPGKYSADRQGRYVVDLE